MPEKIPDRPVVAFEMDGALYRDENGNPGVYLSVDEAKADIFPGASQNLKTCIRHCANRDFEHYRAVGKSTIGRGIIFRWLDDPTIQCEESDDEQFRLPDDDNPFRSEGTNQRPIVWFEKEYPGQTVFISKGWFPSSNMAAEYLEISRGPISALARKAIGISKGSLYRNLTTERGRYTFRFDDDPTLIPLGGHKFKLPPDDDTFSYGAARLSNIRDNDILVDASLF